MTPRSFPWSRRGPSQSAWLGRPGERASKAASAYIGGLVLLAAIGLPDALFPYGVRNNQPGFFRGEALSHPLSGGIWLALTLLLWILWLGLLRAARKENPPALRWMLFFSALAIFPFGWRALSNDPMEYWLWSYGQVHFHLNPLTQVLANTHWPWALRQSSWTNHPNPYGPLFWAWEWVMGHLPGVAFFWVLKLLTLAGYLAAIPLLERLIQLSGRKPFWLLVGWGNPLVILELVGAGHNDILMLLPVLAALVILNQRPKVPGLAGLLLGLSLAIKPVFALSLPALALWTNRRWGPRRLGPEVAGLLVGSLTWFSFYGSPWLYLIRNLRGQAVITGYSLAVLFLFYDHGLIVRVLGALAWASTSIWVARQPSVWWAATLPLAVSFLGAVSWVEPWYLVSILPGLAVYGSRRVLWVAGPVAMALELTFGVTMIRGFSSLAVSYWLVAIAILGLVVGQFWPTLGSRLHHLAVPTLRLGRKKSSVEPSRRPTPDPETGSA